RFGAYHPAGILERGKDSYRLRVADTLLKRDVQLIVRREPSLPASEARKHLARPTRTRWLAGGSADGWLWDAYLAPSGVPLTEVVGPGHTLGWPETLAILEQITEEFHAAGVDGTLAGPVSPRHVYVRPDGRVMLLNPLGDHPLSDEEEMQLLREVAVLALEGQARSPKALPKRIDAVVPIHASKVVNRLLGVSDPLTKTNDVRSLLRELETRPAETATPQRILSLGFLAVALALPLGFFLLGSALFGLIAVIRPSEERSVLQELEQYMRNNREE